MVQGDRQEYAALSASIAELRAAAVQCMRRLALQKQRPVHFPSRAPELPLGSQSQVSDCHPFDKGFLVAFI